MDPTYEVVCYEPGLKQQVIELQRHLWSPNVALNTAYFEWKYERNPYVESPLIYLAMHGGQAVGMRGLFGTQWEGGIPVQTSVVLYADDLVIAPEHRNRGLIPKIMTAAFKDAAQRGYDYAFNLSSGPITFLSSLSMGWHSVGSMEPMRQRSPWVAFRDRSANLVQRLPMLSRLDSTITASFHPRHRSLAEIDSGSVERTVTTAPWIAFEDAPRSTAMAELVERVGHDGRVRHVRDSRYFEWRFQNPLSRYRFLYWLKDRLEGYLVLQEYTSEYTHSEVVNIVDGEASSLTVFGDLLKVAKKLAKGRRLLIWSVSLSEQMKATLVDQGFKLEPQPASAAQQRYALLVRAVGDRGPSETWQFAGQPLLNMKNWDLRMLYSMLG